MKGVLLIEDVDNNRDQWHKLRDVSIGASEAITACGINPHKTLLQYWAEKTGRKKPDEENELMRLGRHMEPYIGGLFSRKTGMHTKPANSLWRHCDVDWAVASPDFFVYSDERAAFNKQDPIGCLETKNVGGFGKWQWENDEVPNYALMQNIWQLGVCGFDMGWVGAFCGGSPDDFYHPEVHYDEEVFQQMLELAGKFRDLVKSDTPPPAQAKDLKLLDALQKTKRAEEKVVELVSDEAKELVDIWREAKDKLSTANKEVKGLQEQCDGARARLIQLMDGATVGICKGLKIAIKEVVTPPYAHPGSAYWNFSIKLPKGA